MMCGGWRQDKPEPYQLVMLRELEQLDILSTLEECVV